MMVKICCLKATVARRQNLPEPSVGNGEVKIDCVADEEGSVSFIVV